MQHGHVKLTPELVLDKDDGIASDSVVPPSDHEFKLLAPLLINTRSEWRRDSASSSNTARAHLVLRKGEPQSSKTHLTGGQHYKGIVQRIPA